MGGDLVDPDRLLDVLDLLWPQIGEVDADFAGDMVENRA